MDVFAWLRDLGLGQYETAFRENAIDASVLSSLTGDDLKEIGVGPVGHRRRLLDAIASLRSEGERLGTASVEEPPKAQVSAPRARETVERRPITVMFCDLVGSTSMASSMDPEDWRELVGAYLDEAAKAVTEYGGHVLKKLGDGLMALFGYPRAQENDAERAARAGLAILRALDELNRKNAERGLPRLAARIGLQSGPVVVDSSGEVFGDAPNVAARVQAAAEPGTLFVTALVQRQVAGFFVAEDKGPHNLKGVSGQPVLYRLLRASGGGRKVGARSLTPLVGRAEELATLTRRWDRTRAGEGQFVQIVGEPGLGKSRLMDEFRMRLAETPHTWVEWSSSQLLQNTPLHPLAEWGRLRFAGESRFTELEGALAQAKLDPAELAPLLASLLDISTPDGRTPQLPADELRRRQLQAVVAWILAAARPQPLVLAFEDLHWADPTTLDLMKTLSERGGQAPILIAATARPDFRAPWATRSHHGVISLSPLDRAQIGQMVGAIAERHALSKTVVEGLSDRTAGVPLFIEELTRLMLEGGAQTVPPTLQQSLAARLDRLGEARKVAQIGAVLGREFSHVLLSAVAELPDSALDAALDKLADADLLFVDGAAPAATYRFKHALIQDAAYDSLLKNQRQGLHCRAAKALVAVPDTQPELVAHHFTQAGDREASFEWWGKAGEVALRRSAFQEAIAHLGKAIEIADAAETSLSQERKSHAGANVRARYAQTLLIARGHTAAETRAAFDHPDLQTSSQLPEVEQLTAIYGKWVSSVMSGELTLARSMAEIALREAQTAQRRLVVAASHRFLSVVDYYLGQLAASLERAQLALDLFDEEWADAHRQSTGIDFLCGTHFIMGQALTVMGEVEAAAEHLELGRKRASVLNHIPTSATTYTATIQLQIFSDRPEETLSVANDLSQLNSENGISGFKITVDMARAWANGRLIDPTAGVVQLQAIWTDIQQVGAALYGFWWFPCQADLLLQLGRTKDALALADAGVVDAERIGCVLVSAPLRRLRGEALILVDPAAAEEAFRESIDIAREQGSRLFELQGVLAYARLLHSTDRHLEARERLGAALKGFSPTLELPAFTQAQTLLLSLERCPK